MDDRANNPGHQKKDRIIQSGSELIFKWIKIHLTGYLEQLDEHLFKLADKSDNNASQTRYFQAREALKGQHKHIQTLFFKHISQAFNHYLKNQPTVLDDNCTPSRQSALSLVKNSDLEETLAINTMSKKCNAHCADILYQLNQRLSALRGGSRLNTRDNPVAPGVFARALKHAIADLTLDDRSRLVIYKVFESVFMQQLSKLYELLNEHYQHQGLLPGLHLATPAQQVSLPDELRAHTSETSIARQVALFKAIKQLQAQRSAPPNVSADKVPVAQIIKNIAKLQQQTAALLDSLSNSSSLVAGDISQFVRQSEQEALKTQEVDPHVVEIVGLLFEFMLNEQQLPDCVKTLLSYLHTPFLKIALLDKAFFNHPQHPARQLLNSLVAAAERWVEPSGKHKNELFLQIKSIVQKLLNEFDNDVRLFSELAFEFNQYLRQYARRVRLSEKRAMQAAQGENTLQEIRLKIESYLKKKVANIALPDAIQTLLFVPWANFLSFNLLRFGSHSDQWRMATQTVDDILWFSQPHDKNDLNVQRRIKQLTSTLPETLQAGFDTVGYDSVRGIHLLNLLQQISVTAAATSERSATSIAEADIDNIAMHSQANTAGQQDEHLAQLSNLELGTWFIFNADTPEPQRVKLAWIDTNMLKFMFVNRMGQQVGIRTAQQLSRDIRSNKVTILSKLETRPFFEKAMQRVLEQLKQRETSDESKNL